MTNTPTTSEKKRDLILAGVLTIAALVVGYWQITAFATRIGWDTVSYLELAEAIRTQRYDLALSPYWSPLFPVLFSIVSSLSPSLSAERTLLCVFQFFTFVFYCAASIWFWVSVLKAQQKFIVSDDAVPLPRIATIVLMGSVSLISSLVVGDLAVKGPDMLGAAFYLCANAMIVTCLCKKQSYFFVTMLGLTMGLTYLAKTFFISWTLPCLCLLFLLRDLYGLDVKKFALMCVTFALTVALYAVPLSVSLGKPTVGESGSYQVVFSSTDQTLPMVPMVHGSRETLHPSRILFDNPRVYEFADPFDVSYPPWFNPHYWNEGIRAKLDWNLYSAMLVEKAISLFFGFGIYILLLHVSFCLIQRSPFPYSRTRLKALCPVLLTAVICMVLLYFLSAAVGRYFMGFIAPVFAGMLLCYRHKVTDTSGTTKAMSLVSFLMLLAFALKSLLYAYFAMPAIADSLKSMTSVPLPQIQQTDPHAATAAKLAELGIKPKDRIARIARDEGGEFYWTRLANIRVVAECVDPDAFFAAPPERRAELYQKLKSIGVKAIVLDWSNRKPTPKPPTPTEQGWTSVTDTNNFVMLIHQDSQ